MKRGDVVLVRFSHPSGIRGKRRPAVVVQADSYAAVVGTLVVAEITTNLAFAGDSAGLFIDLTTAEGQATGLLGDSVVSCLALAAVYAVAVTQKLGSLSPVMVQHLDGCLKTGGSGADATRVSERPPGP